MFNMIKEISILVLFLASAITIEDNGEPENSHDHYNAYYRPHDKGFALKRDTKQSLAKIEHVDKGNPSQDATATSLNQNKSLLGDKIKDTEKQNTTIKYSEGENNVKEAQVSSQTDSIKLSIPKEKINSTKPGNVEVENKNHTLNITEPKLLPVSNTGVVKRGLIVFGAFGLMAVVYFIFYRKKSKNFESNNTHNNNDTNQFRYGVLQSDDRRDNLELSRIPLTMESDEEEDDDLEIFDLEQKKKSLSYVNLQTTDEDIVLHSSSKDESKNNLLLDIEDASSDTLINWSSNSSKSIL